ncbi:saccharopine dehydrogenase [Amylibacter kogurei]|uniref:Saccharopine dehydrogenase [NAD(+), L-lysine-forming] n=1 Tax=Paramylibacter kogurei TaxID=1889778 RepID=A0A2G5K6I4_9RHOB|nr:saccharopine dehydrogenase [Amylibacter kogurei]PIB25045.1 saccharopine dehydrogenase [Amylibacter kogurei]
MTPHFWLRAEDHNNEHRSPITPTEASALMQAGAKLTVERSDDRAHHDADFAALGCDMVERGTWMDAPRDTVILGLKELPILDFPLIHRHIQFAHVFKGQDAAPQNLDRFKRGGGTLYDLEFLVDDTGRRVAAFGYWAGFAGAAIGLMAWIAQQRGETLGAVPSYPNQAALVDELKEALGAVDTRPNAIVIGALGRVGTGAGDLFSALNLDVTKWDMDETASGGPFPEIAQHNIFLNCILASPKTPLFFGADDVAKSRSLSVIADIACDPNSPYNPIPIYGDNTRFDAPIIRVADTPVLDVMAIDNLPSMLPLESSADYAAQLLPILLDFSEDKLGTWARAKSVFDEKIAAL